MRATLEGKAMFQFAYRRDFVAVFGIITIISAIWAAWLIETPGFMPL
jgi:hypothetical protein